MPQKRCFHRIFIGFFTLFVTTLLAEVPVLADEAATVTYPLEQILSIAKNNATTLDIIKKESDAGMAEVDIYRSEAFPYVSFNSGASYVSTSQATQRMQQELQQYMTMQIMGPILNVLKENNPDMSLENSSSSFSYPDRMNGYAFNWSLTLQQPLITFGKVRSALKLARMRECSLKDMSRLNTDLFYLRVVQEFSLAYLAQCDVSINQAAVERSRLLLIRLQSEFDAGRAIKRELLRMEALAQHDRANFIAAEGVVSTATHRLLQSVNFDDTTAYIPLAIDDNGTLSTTIPASGPGTILLFLKKNEASLYKEQYNYLRSAYFPSINLVGNIANQFMTIDTNGLLQDLLPPGTSGEALQGLAESFDEFNPKPYRYFDPSFFNYTIGLQLSWTIFDGNRTRAQCRQAKSNLQKTLLELETMEKQDKIAVEEARNQIGTVDSLLSAVRLQAEAGYQALTQTEQDYKDGFSDFSTLLDTEKEYRDAIRQFNALKIQRILAIVQLRIALGLPVFGDEL